MQQSKFAESQIVAALKQVESGRQVKDLCREVGIVEWRRGITTHAK